MLTGRNVFKTKRNETGKIYSLYVMVKDHFILGPLQELFQWNGRIMKILQRIE